MSIKQVIVMRRDLSMRKGKMIAQGSHASMAFLTNRFDYSRPDKYSTVATALLTSDEIEWLNTGHRKICVKIDSEAELLFIFEKAESAGLTVNMITDSGLTEFNGVPTRTCLAIGPNKDEDIDKITGNLVLY